MTFSLYSNGIRSYVLLLLRASISSFTIHREASWLPIASCKVDGSSSSISKQYVTLPLIMYSKYQAGFLLSQFDRKASRVLDLACSCSSYPSTSSEESRTSYFSLSSTWNVVVSNFYFEVLSFSFSCFLPSTNITYLLIITL